MAEIAPGGGGPNRLFVMLAVGLAGLLVLGLLAVGGIFLIPRFLGTSSASPTVRAAATPTRAIALATLAPTDTPEPTLGPTPTLVNAAGGASPTTEASGTPSTGELPKSGLGEDFILLGAGLVLVLIVFAARRTRTA